MEFNEWFKVNDLAYMFGECPRGTTYAYVRGNFKSLSNFIYELSRTYCVAFANLDKLDYDEKLREVLETGEDKHIEPIITFSNDRIRLIRRLDDVHLPPQGGPYWGSENHLEIWHHEQCGGDSREEMIQKVLTAVNK